MYNSIKVIDLEILQEELRQVVGHAELSRFS
jgi:hypothetical protein